MSRSRGRAIADITAENTGTEAINPGGGNSLNISISGTFVATITLQRRFIDGDQISPYRDIKTYIAPIEEVAEEPESSVEYRLFCKTGAFTNGTASLRLSY